MSSARAKKKQTSTTSAGSTATPSSLHTDMHINTHVNNEMSDAMGNENDLSNHSESEMKINEPIEVINARTLEIVTEKLKVSNIVDLHLVRKYWKLRDSGIDPKVQHAKDRSPVNRSANITTTVSKSKGVKRNTKVDPKIDKSTKRNTTVDTTSTSSRTIRRTSRRGHV